MPNYVIVCSIATCEPYVGLMALLSGGMLHSALLHACLCVCMVRSADVAHGHVACGSRIAMCVKYGGQH